MRAIGRTTAQEVERDIAAQLATGRFVVVVDTTPFPTTRAGGARWDRASPEVTNRRNADETALKERYSHWGEMV